MEDEWVTGKITLNVGEEPIEIELTVPVKPIKLRRMLPIFQQMSNSFIGMAVENLKSRGEEISCRAGCGACCVQLVPIAEAEAYQISELVENMPEPRRTEIRQRFEDACKQFHEINIFERIEAGYVGTDEEYNDAIKDYFRQKISCPFLENNSCSIHESRPITCREYLATSPPEYCSSADGEGVSNVQHSMKVKESVILMSNSEPKRKIPFVPLIRSLEWTENNPDKSPELTGEQWVGLFFGHLFGNQSKPES